MLSTYRNPTFVIFFVAFVFNYVECYKVDTEKGALAYLEQYGYVDPKEMPSGFTLRDCNKKLMEFQKLSHIEVTGELDDATLKAMNTPRCGCPDFIHLSFKDDTDHPQQDEGKAQDRDNDHGYRRRRNHHHHHHHHRSYQNTNKRNQSEGSKKFLHSERSLMPQNYTVSERFWDKKVVTYDIVQYPTRYGLRVSASDIENAIHKAFKIWEQHIELEFRHQPNSIEKADIEISFVSTYHGDSYPFDGPGKTLAHAFFPGSGLGGDVHFEEEEDWSLGVYNGVDVLYVAIHELGHSLGLGHSSTYGAVMYPMYRGYTPNLQLHSDDIYGVQTMYGRKYQVPQTTQVPVTRATTTTRRTTTRRPIRNDTTTVKTTKPPTRPTQELCDDPYIDAITTMFGNTVLVFKDMNVYEIGRNGEGVLPGWPKRIDDYFKGMEGDLDCVVTRSNGKTYFFKETKYWRFTGRQMDRGYPRSIAEYFPRIPDNLDACFEWDSEFVFTKDSKFWRFNTRTRPQVDQYFPMTIQHWGLRSQLDAAFTAPNGTLYFLQGPYFWEFDKESHQVIDQASRKLTSEDWFGCEDEEP